MLPEVWLLVGLVGCAGWLHRCARLEVGGGCSSWLVELAALQEGRLCEGILAGY